METRSCTSQVSSKRAAAAFTLVELVIAIFLFTVCVAGVIMGHVFTTYRAEWSARSLAAQSLASQAVEQAHSAQWVAESWPRPDELPPTNYVQIETLDVPVSGGAILYATNYVSITTVSSNPPLRQLRADCVWRFMNRGLFTNTIITIRAPDQ